MDVNLLLYAYDAASPHHAAAKSWWEESVTKSKLVGLPWHTLIGFIRISTNPRAVDVPFSVTDARDIVQTWLDQPSVVIAEPTSRHWDVLKHLLVEAQAPANLVPDAHLAALAIEHGATLCSSDRDFARFPGLSWTNPLV